MPRLIWVFTRRTGHTVGFVIRRLISLVRTSNANMFHSLPFVILWLLRSMHQKIANLRAPPGYEKVDKNGPEFPAMHDFLHSSIHVCTHSSIHPSVRLSIVCLSIHPAIYPKSVHSIPECKWTIGPSVQPASQPNSHLAFHPWICTFGFICSWSSVCPESSVRPSARPSVRPSISL